MAPIVHGLEQQYQEHVDFLYLDVQDPRTVAAKARLGFRATPHFVTLTVDGRIVETWQGVHDAAVLKRGLERLVKTTAP